MLRELDHQRHEPDDAEGDMQPVRADEREEARQESAALRPRPDLDQMVEFVKLDPEEGEPEQPGDREPELDALHPALLHLEHGKTIGDRREEQHRGVERDELEVEQILRRGPRGIAAAEHGVAGEEDREDEAIAHQIDPEAQHRAVPLGMRMLVEVVEGDGLVRGDCLGAHRVRLRPPAGGCALPRPR